jgi:hypothetical protein
MVELPEYKLGDLLECINGIKYSNVRVLNNNNIIILYGDNSGHIMKILDWFSMIKDYNGIIHNTNSLDNIYNDDLTNLRTTTIRTISSSSSIRTSSSIRSDKSVTFNPIIDIKIINPDPLEQSEPEPIKKSKLSWYYNIFLCCVDLD